MKQLMLKQGDNILRPVGPVLGYFKSFEMINGRCRVNTFETAAEYTGDPKTLKPRFVSNVLIRTPAITPGNPDTYSLQLYEFPKSVHTQWQKQANVYPLGFGIKVNMTGSGLSTRYKVEAVSDVLSPQEHKFVWDHMVDLLAYYFPQKYNKRTPEQLNVEAVVDVTLTADIFYVKCKCGGKKKCKDCNGSGMVAI